MKRSVLILSPLLLLGACASQPTRPTVMVMPGKHKSQEAFRRDDAACLQKAGQATQGMSDRANIKQIGINLASLALGAGMGGLINGGTGAAIGVGTAGVAGVGLGGVLASGDQSDIQHSYDVSYYDCMVERGNQVNPVPILGQPG